MTDITVSLASVTGGLNEGQARDCLQKAFPGQLVDLTRAIPGGSWHGTAFPSQGQPMNMVVTNGCHVHRLAVRQDELR